MSHIPAGIITIWFGAIIDIPAGWALCDGTLGTPDLRNLFVIGAGDTFNPGDVGGDENHDHAFVGDGHNHTLLAGAGVASGVGFQALGQTVAVTGTTDEDGALPPFHALAFIMSL